MQSKRIGVIAVCSGDIGLNCMGHSVHTGVCNEFLRHGLCEFRINNGNIRSDLKVSDWVFNALIIIGDDGESGDFGCSTGSRGDCAEMRFGSQFWKAKDVYKRQILQGFFYLWFGQSVV